MSYKELFEAFQNNADISKAANIKTYMKNKFEFSGISTPTGDRFQKIF